MNFGSRSADGDEGEEYQDFELINLGPSRGLAMERDAAELC